MRMRKAIMNVHAGISFTDDKLLQWRLVAYDDAQVCDQPTQSVFGFAWAPVTCTAAERAFLSRKHCAGSGQVSTCLRTPPGLDHAFGLFY